MTFNRSNTTRTLNGLARVHHHRATNRPALGPGVSYQCLQPVKENSCTHLNFSFYLLNCPWTGTVDGPDALSNDHRPSTAYISTMSPTRTSAVMILREGNREDDPPENVAEKYYRPSPALPSYQEAFPSLMIDQSTSNRKVRTYLGGSLVSHRG